MEALETCIGYWEDALAAYRNTTKDGSAPFAVLGPEETAFCKDIQQLLEYAIELQENSEMLFLDEMSILFRSESGVKEGTVKDVDLSGGESFASAQDMVRSFYKNAFEMYREKEKIRFTKRVSWKKRTNKLPRRRIICQ